MDRLHWAQIPAGPRRAVEEHFGPVTAAHSTPPGLTLGVAARLDTATGPLFLKAIRADDPTARLYERERIIGRQMPHGIPAPRLLWSHDVDGWILLAFEYLDGMSADLSPGSADIPLVLDALACLTVDLTPSPCPAAPSITTKLNILYHKAHRFLDEQPQDIPSHALYTRLLRGFDPTDVTGTSLLHADLHAGNFLITGRRAYAIDWALASHGAPWVDLALLAPRFIAAGHTPQHTDELLHHVAAWQHAPRDKIAGLVVTLTLFREYEAHHGPPRLRAKRKQVANAGHAWLRYCTN